MVKLHSEYETKNEFLAVLAHELRNPLASILSSVELLNIVGTGAPEAPELLGVVDERVRAISLLLNDFLEAPQDFYERPQLKKEPTSQHKIPLVHAVPAPALTLKTGQKVLVVDDNETAADALSQLLRLRGYDVEVAYSGESAFDKALIFQPQVAIVDIGMPIMDGYALAIKFHQEDLSCTYIALTGYGQTHDKQKALLAGFDYHLTKPAGIKEIELILQTVLNQSKK